MNSAKTPIAFLSYVREDDKHERGRITKIRQQLESEVKFQGVQSFRIFQDKDNIEWGEN